MSSNILTYKIPNSERVLYFRGGTSDEGAIQQIFMNGEYKLEKLRRAEEIFEFVQTEQAIGARPLIVDAGANIGASTVYFSQAFPLADVVAIEPEADNFALLCANVEGLSVTCHKAALSSHTGNVKMVDPGEGHWAYRTELTDDQDGIRSVTIPQIFEQVRWQGVFPFIVKIDIEGFEHDVFAGNTGWLKRTPIVIIELHDWMLPKAGTARGFLQCVVDEPRDFIISGENIFSISHSIRETVYG